MEGLIVVRVSGVVSVVVGLAIAAGGVSSTATASESTGAGIGRGEAIVRLDASEATVRKGADGSYRLILPAGSTGQWMGERTDGKGVEAVRVGDLTGEKLAKRWGRFRYDSSVLATLVWGSDGSLVRMSRPKVTGEGVVVRFEKVSRGRIPETIGDVSLNIRRADDHESRDTVTNVIMTANFGYHFNLQDEDAQSYGKFYNDTNGNKCWDTYMYASLTDPSQYTKTVPDKTCDSIEYNGSVSTDFTGPNAPPNTSNGAAWVNVELTPPNADPFNYQQMVYTWYAG